MCLSCHRREDGRRKLSYSDVYRLLSSSEASYGAGRRVSTIGSCLGRSVACGASAGPPQTTPTHPSSYSPRSCGQGNAAKESVGGPLRVESGLATIARPQCFQRAGTMRNASIGLALVRIILLASPINASSLTGSNPEYPGRSSSPVSTHKIILRLPSATSHSCQDWSRRRSSFALAFR